MQDYESITNVIPSKRILVAGPESSGTKMLAELLTRAGADVVHHSPNYRLWNGDEFHRARDFDKVVIIVRNGFANAKSMVDNHHADSEDRGRVMQAQGLLSILSNLWAFSNVYFTTYEALVHEQPDSVYALIDQMELPLLPLNVSIGNGNAKYYGGDYFRDARDLHERWSHDTDHR